MLLLRLTAIGIRSEWNRCFEPPRRLRRHPSLSKEGNFYNANRMAIRCHAVVNRHDEEAAVMAARVEPVFIARVRQKPGLDPGAAAEISWGSDPFWLQTD